MFASIEKNKKRTNYIIIIIIREQGGSRLTTRADVIDEVHCTRCTIYPLTKCTQLSWLGWPPFGYRRTGGDATISQQTRHNRGRIIMIIDIKFIIY